MLGWAIAALGGCAAWRVFGGYPPADAAPLALSRRELATLGAVADALFPEGGAVPPSGRRAGVPAYIDQLVAASSARQRLLMHALFFLVEHGTLLFPAPGGWRGLRRFTALDTDQQMAVIASWQRSRWWVRRLVFTSLRALCTLGYFADPAVLRALRLAPYAIETPRCEADGLYPAIGASRSSLRDVSADGTPLGAPTPLRSDDPLLAGYAETA